MTQFRDATIQKAIDDGLKQLNVKRDQVSVDVISEGKPGFFGIGRKPAIIDMKPISSVQNIDIEDDEEIDKAKQIQNYLENILAAMDFQETVKFEKNDDCLKFNIKTSDDVQSKVIGKHGKNINALQTIVQEYAYFLNFHDAPVVLDSGNYRERRQHVLEQLSLFKAEQVEATKKPVYFDPMPSMERKVIYQSLEGNDKVFARTQGRGLDKYIVIRPAK